MNRLGKILTRSSDRASAGPGEKAGLAIAG